MARPLGIEFSGALYHVRFRGDRREAIYEDDGDRESFLGMLGEVVERFNWLCHAYCLMTNHYHLVVETVGGNLSKGMRQLNGAFTQASNRRHRRTGHLFQGRFKGILVDKDSYLLELSRYVVLNPVRAGMVDRAGHWPWSSYRAMVGEAPAPEWLATDGLLAQFASRRSRARERYRELVSQGSGEDSIWTGLRRQIDLGDEAFIERMQRKMDVNGDELSIPKRQRRGPGPSVAAITRKHRDRNEAIVAAYVTGAFSYREVAEHFGLHLATVGSIIRRAM